MGGDFVLAGNLPIRLEAAEVIDANAVVQLYRAANPLDPPGELAGGHLVPAVDRISPKLPGRTEIIGRNAGHDLRTAIGMQIELILVHPHVGAVVSDKDWQVANDRDAALVGVTLQRRPLLVELELDE